MSPTIKSLFLSILFIVISSSLILISSACFITNCPPGGKRSGRFDFAARKCTPCGPPDLGGQCYGSQICCSKEFGCLIGTPDTEVCAIENTLTSPCENSGESCGGFDPANQINGHCAAEGICCSAEVCTMDSACNWGDLFPNPPMLAGLRGVGNEDEDCDDPVAPPAAAPSGNKVNEKWKQGQILFPHLKYGFPTPSMHYQLMNKKRFYDDEQHDSSAIDKRSNQSQNPKDNFPVLLKSTRPGLNSIVRKLFQIQKRSAPGRMVQYKSKA